ncbi:MAG TPA: electron transfer flavoprotein subunit beta/FixA family protein [Anaerolineae bacterium]|nr:electron transfer flavoprotein subunit beta/FixA family protein [Anaerolineae bacterium]
MNVVVCTKQTPSTTAVYEVKDGVVSWEDPGGKPLVVNPWDEYAIEEAIRVAENHGADKAIALTYGASEATEVLKTCLAMGCKEAVLVSDEAFAGSDAVATARILAAAVNKLDDVQLLVFGKQAIDGDTGLTPVMVARKLGWTPITYVSAIKEIGDGQITVERVRGNGKETVTAPLPAVISVVKEINEPRYPSFMGIRKAGKAKIPTWTASDLEVDGPVGGDASKADWSNVFTMPAREGSVEMIEGETVEEKASQLVDKLFEEKVI